MSMKGNASFVIADHPTPKIDREGVAYTLNSRDYKNAQCVVYKKQGHPHYKEEGQGWEETELNDTLNAFENGENRTTTLVLENHPADSRVKICKDGIFQTLSSRMGTGGGNVPMVVENKATNEQYQECWETGVYKFCDCNKCPHLTECEQKYRAEYDPGQNMVVRRLTPLERTRLQGYPDGWVDIGEWTDSKGKKHKDADTPKYKALGNSIALPFWEWLAKRIVQHIDHEPTMASLFDGIGGFPVVFQKAGCKPVWASEIEDFPIAVTKKHFPDEEKITKEDIFEWVTE